MVELLVPIDLDSLLFRHIVIVLGVGLILLPESPRYLLMKGREEQAQGAIARILGRDKDSAEVHEEYAEIAANLHHERAVGAPSYLACFKSGPGKNRLRVCTGIALQALQQLTGIVSAEAFFHETLG